MKISPPYRSIITKKPVIYSLAVAAAGLVILMIILVYPYVPDGKDWALSFRPAVIRMFSGLSPYAGPFANPPWTLLLLAPLALLPPKLGSAILVIASPLLFCFVAYKLGAKLLPILFFAFSVPVIYNTFNINIDWMPALGLLLPPQIGLFFVLAKPQAGIGVAIFWLFEAWQKERVKGVIKLCWPVTVALLLSFIAYGFWPIAAARWAAEWRAQPFGNANLFPWGIPIGIGILIFSIWKKLRNLSISASPMFSPYVTMQSWSSFLLGLVNYPALSIAACIISWVITVWAWTH